MSAPSDSETRERPSNRDPPPPPPPRLSVPVAERYSFSVHAPIGSRVRPPRPRYEQSASNGTWNEREIVAQRGGTTKDVERGRVARRSMIGSREGVYCNGEIINAYKNFSRGFERKRYFTFLKYPEIGRDFERKKEKNSRNLECYRGRKGTFIMKAARFINFHGERALSKSPSAIINERRITMKEQRSFSRSME